MDGAGNLYVADSDNHRVQKFAPGYPGWRQANINGFGDPNNSFISTLDVFGGQMYAGTWSARVWRTSNGQTWSPFQPGWSESTALYDTQPFSSFLYFGTYTDDGGEIWRTDGISWTQVVSGGFGDANNLIINALAVYSDALYAATGNFPPAIGGSGNGVEVWHSDSGGAGSWTQVNTDGFGAGPTWIDLTMDVYQNHLYIGLSRVTSSGGALAELWRTDNGVDWTPVFTDGLGVAANTYVAAMAEFKGAFYIALRNTATGGQVWRSTNGLNWTSVFTGGLGNPQNGRPYGLIPFDGYLYVVFNNPATGAEVWRTADGTNWHPVARDGWGDRNNMTADYFDKGAAVFNDRLYIGTANMANGGEIWLLAYQKVFLPLVLRNR